MSECIDLASRLCLIGTVSQPMNACVHGCRRVPFELLFPATSTVSRPRIAAAGLTCRAPTRCRLKVFYLYSLSWALEDGDGLPRGDGGPPNAARRRPTSPPSRSPAGTGRPAPACRTAVFCPHAQPWRLNPRRISPRREPVRSNANSKAQQVAG